jgi:hypothetical protein
MMDFFNPKIEDKKPKSTTIETLRHAPIIYAIHDHIVNLPKGASVSDEELSERFFGKVSDGNERKVRKAIREMRLDKSFQRIIVTTADRRYKVAETDDEALAFIKSEMKVACAYLDAYWALHFKLNHDQQRKLQLGAGDSPEYRAIMRGKPEEPQVELIVAEHNQVGFDFREVRI